jgi:hypothetical protein
MQGSRRILQSLPPEMPAADLPPSPPYSPAPNCRKLWQQPACLLWWRLAPGRCTTGPLQHPRTKRTPISGRKSRSWTYPESPRLLLSVHPRNNSTAARSALKAKLAAIRALPETAPATLARDAHATAKSSTVQSRYVRQVCRLHTIPHGVMLLPRPPPWVPICIGMTRRIA